ncbi:RNA polymerase sigma-70 factor [Bacteroidota bacterium]
MKISYNNKNEFKILFNSFYPALCSFASSFNLKTEQAEDIVQEVFITLWDKIEDFNNENAIKSFLYTSVKNKCINYLEHKKVIQKHADHAKNNSFNTSNFDDQIIEEETHRLIYHAINELPASCKNILLLSINGLKNSEIAEDLNLSINTVKTQKKIAYKQLKIKLKDVYFISVILFNQFI